ncbi:MAG TPA: class I SAM-dependent methyltransferase [Halanaerobiales bacterium]|nr:class I SAM-dependent methyltransferase [Halanaerobiales bacterium]
MDDKAYTKSFASIYDQVMDNVPYDYWYKYLIDILDYYNKKPQKVIDLACGTGNMTYRFAERNAWDLYGVDISQEMLEIARQKENKKDVNVKFYQKDLRNFSPDQKFDLAFSLFDSLNYILEYKDLKKIFDNTYNFLKSDGFFIFDMNTIKRLMNINSGTMLLKGENYSCFWQDIIDKENRIWKVKLKIYFGENRVNYYEEVHKETSYPIQDIIAALKWAGFSEVEVFSAYTFNKAKESDNRVYFVASKGLLKKNNKLLNQLSKKFKWNIIKTFIL